MTASRAPRFRCARPPRQTRKSATSCSTLLNAYAVSTCAGNRPKPPLNVGARRKHHIATARAQLERRRQAPTSSAGIAFHRCNSNKGPLLRDHPRTMGTRVTKARMPRGWHLAARRWRGRVRTLADASVSPMSEVLVGRLLVKVCADHLPPAELMCLASPARPKPTAARASLAGTAP